MHLEGFLFKVVPVRGPMGLYDEEKCFATGGSIDLSDDEAFDLKKMRFKHPHGGVIRYLSEDEIDENMRLGLVGRPVPGPRRGPGRPRKDEITLD